MMSGENLSTTGPAGVPAVPGPSRLVLIALHVPLLFLIAWLDFATGYELSFFVFYFIPVALSAWCLGGAASLLTAIVCASIWSLVDFYSGRPYSVPAYAIWNVMMRLFTFAVIGLSLARMKRDLAREQELNRRLQQALADLEATASESRKLRDQFVTVCAWTRRIKDEGHWMSMEDYLVKHLGVKLTHGMSEAVVEDIQRQIDSPEETGKLPQ